MSPELQRAVARAALYGDAAARATLVDACAAPPLRTLAALHVHASTTRDTLSQALAESFPSVRAMLGDAGFAELAGGYLRLAPPRRASLFAWGDGFADHLQAATGEPRLAALARLDRAWLVAFTAAEAEPLSAAALAGLAPEVLAATRLALHPSCVLVRGAPRTAALWLAFGRLPLACVRRVGDAVGALLARPDADVICALLDAGRLAFVTALGDGMTLSAALDAALDADARFDPASALADGFADGLFVAIRQGETP